MWLETMMALIGEQFDVADAICGVVVSVRQRHDKLALQTNAASNEADTFHVVKQKPVRKKKILNSRSHEDFRQGVTQWFVGRGGTEITVLKVQLSNSWFRQMDKAYSFCQQEERIPIEEVFEQLKCNQEGRTSDEGATRLEIFGPNKLEEKRANFSSSWALCGIHCRGSWKPLQ